jgi:hypothetical protein
LLGDSDGSACFTGGDQRQQQVCSNAPCARKRRVLLHEGVGAGTAVASPNAVRNCHPNRPKRILLGGARLDQPSSMTVPELPNARSGITQRLGGLEMTADDPSMPEL